MISTALLAIDSLCFGLLSNHNEVSGQGDDAYRAFNRAAARGQTRTRVGAEWVRRVSTVDTVTDHEGQNQSQRLRPTG
jgi:hypothetical protein